MCPDEWSHVTPAGKALVREMLKLDATSELHSCSVLLCPSHISTVGDSRSQDAWLHLHAWNPL